MELDDDVCVCFHVSLRKLWHFARRERPRVHSQMTECLGAGTGCGSCEALLKIIAEHGPGDDADVLGARLEALLAARDARRRARGKEG